MEVIRYEEKYKQHFIDSNKRCIEDYFEIESHDIGQLENLEIYLKQRVMVFFAIKDYFVLSNTMAIGRQPKVWEVCKFATNKEFQGRGAGKAIFVEALNYAKNNGAKKTVIYSNKKLKTALHIYNSYSFIAVPLDIAEYERCGYQAKLVLNG